MQVMPATKINTKKTTTLVDAVGVGIFAIIIELIGRSIFAVWDTNNQVYGAKYWAETGMPWMHAWMGLDLIVGTVSKAVGDPFLAITILGCIMNGGTAVAIYAISKQLGIQRSHALTISIITALWFLPHLGGWIGDNLSFLIGISPFLIYAASKQRWTYLTSIGLGLSLSIGTTLKLNAFLPAFGIGCLWLVGTLIFNKQAPNTQEDSESSSNLFANCVIIGLITLLSGLALNKLISTEAGLYSTIIQTYGRVSQSVASSQLSGSRLLSIPLNIDLLEALNKGQKGVLIFLPLIVGFWASIIFSVQQLISNETSIQQKQLHSFALFLILASAFTAVGLGRGLTHRMLLLPAGVLMSFSDFPLSKKQIQFWMTALTTASVISWIMFACLQHTTNTDLIYDPRGLTRKGQTTSFCINNAGSSERISEAEGNHAVVNASLLGQTTESQNIERCWTAKEFQNDFAGLPYSQQIANSMGVIYKNERPGKTVFYEKWDNKQATKEGIKDWVMQEVRSINSLKMPYFLERVEINNAELEATGYPPVWQKLRQDRLRLLSSELNAVKIGTVGNIGVWKTKWAEPINKGQKQ